MAIYKLGSKGEEVRRIQQKLTELGLYQGPLDGDFGGGTNAAVIKFQKSKGLTGDGLVGRTPGRPCLRKIFPSRICSTRR